MADSIVLERESFRAPLFIGTFPQLPSFPDLARVLRPRQETAKPRLYPIAPESRVLFGGWDDADNKYFAYYVDLHGVALASYELQGADDPLAVSEARSLLRFHASLEIWHGARLVARLIGREETGQRLGR